MAALLPCTHFSSAKFTFLPSSSSAITIPALRPLRPRLNHRCRLSLNSIRASVSTVDSPLASSTDGRDEKKKPLLQVTDLTAVIAESRQEIIKGVNLLVNEGEIHAIMGKNGSGKSTLSKV
ncbi:hypothetical protein Patl1_05825 [Pistacia atlantica]|uniref:Uncharacterized protein n=1 Tax=Pistacia atlantica TaxID=434234 RepID=A0ACC1BWL8_9ROSI|nr:hypothetical protein Patl1_05825 [Pistacia atlantica]